MRRHTAALSVLAAAAAVFAAAPLHAQGSDFSWSGAVAAGGTLEIRGINGRVRAVASPDGAAHVTATRTSRRSDPASVQIEVVEHRGGVTVCAVYPTPDGARRQNECRPGGGSNSVEDNDVTVDFEIRVPAGVRFHGSTVNGALELEGLRSDVQASTVNGGVRVRTSGFVSRASTVNGDIEIEMPAGLDADLHASTVNGVIESDFEVSISGTVGPRTVRGTIGRGGETLRASTVNGSIRLRRI